MENLWKFIKFVWQKGLRGPAIAISVVALAAVLELAQSNLLGDAAFRVAARYVPWKPLLSERAALDASFRLTRPDDAPVKLKDDAAACPVGSKIAFSFERSRPGWVSAFGVTDPFEGGPQPSVFSLVELPADAAPTKAIAVSGEVPYSGEFVITSADGLELLVIIGFDKPFDALNEIIPQLQAMQTQLGKGGSARLTGFENDWADRPVIATCDSGE